MPRIGFLGAYSIDNAGDVLVGYATRQALRRLLPHAGQATFAPEFPHPFWRHDFSQARGIDAPITPVPTDGDLSWARGLDALIIGGGGILNLDPSFRAFLPAADAPPAAWNALCSQNQAWYLSAYAESYEAVRRCCAALRYVSVRNRTTLHFLRRCGYDGLVQVVPDPALLLEIPPNQAGPLDQEVTQALSASGIDPSDPARPLLGVSVGKAVTDPRCAAFFTDLFAALGQAMAPPLRAQVLFFPFGALYGDEGFQRAAAVRVPGARVLTRPLSPLALWRLIGRLSLHVATRFHAMLAAYAQDVPFLVLDEYLADDVASSKNREFIADHGLEPLYLCPFLGHEPGWKLRGVIEGGRQASFAPALAADRQRLRRHYADMARALGLVVPIGPGVLSSI